LQAGRFFVTHSEESLLVLLHCIVDFGLGYFFFLPGASVAFLRVIGEFGKARIFCCQRPHVGLLYGLAGIGLGGTLV
jgi:hypothetical protein